MTLEDPTSFESIASLGLSEQRALLRDGDPLARLHAAWALALRLGAAASPLLRNATPAELSDGLRQQYVVVLAGLGERDILWAMASHDRSEEVRATAVRYFVRTAPAPDDPPTVSLAASLLVSAPATLRLAVVDEFEAGRLSLDEPRLVACLEPPSTELARRAAVAILARSAVSAQAIAAAARAIAREEDPSEQRCLLRAMSRDHLVAFVDVLTTESPDCVARLLPMLIDQYGPFEWSEIGPLTKGAAPDVQERVLRSLGRPLPAPAVTWAGEVYRGARASEVPSSLRWTMYHALVESLSAGAVDFVDASARSMLQDDIVDDLRALEIEDEEGESEWSEQEMEDRRRLLARTLELLQRARAH